MRPRSPHRRWWWRGVVSTLCAALLVAAVPAGAWAADEATGTAPVVAGANPGSDAGGAVAPRHGGDAASAATSRASDTTSPPSGRGSTDRRITAGLGLVVIAGLVTVVFLLGGWREDASTRPTTRPGRRNRRRRAEQAPLAGDAAPRPAPGRQAVAHAAPAARPGPHVRTGTAETTSAPSGTDEPDPEA